MAGGAHDPAPARTVDAVADACSHQLGEAVTIVGGYVDLLREDDTVDEAILNALDGGIGRVRRVVEDLLDLTRLAAREPRPQRHELAALVERAIAELGSDGASLRVELARSSPTIVGDEAQLACLLRQLLRAAAARRVRQPEVRVAVGAELSADGRVRLTIADDAAPTAGGLVGAGRGSGPLVGAGAGELIARRIAAAHGGAVESDDPTRIVIDLPGAP